MTSLMARILTWGLIVVVAVIAWAHVQERVHARRYPQRVAIETALKKRLGPLTPKQQRDLDSAILGDPVAAYLAISKSQNQGNSPSIALASLLVKRSAELDVQEMAFEAFSKDKPDPAAAAQFVDSTLHLWAFLEDTDHAAASSLLDDLKHLSPEEYRNVGYDASYLLIAPRIDSRFRDEFRKNQEMLTPLLAVSERAHWNDLLALSQRAEPKVGEIFRDRSLGRPYAAVYMLHAPEVRELIMNGFSEKKALEFLGVNAAVLSKLAKADPHWVASVMLLDKTIGPDGTTTLFTTACRDPAVLWLVSQDVSVRHADSLQVLSRYAGTDLPAILHKYVAPQALLSNAIKSLVQFDFEHDSDPAKRKLAARFLSSYQDNDAFKAVLEKCGPALIPAMAIGGPDVLAAVQKNPNDLYKSIDTDGSPRGTPFWTYFPGGNIAYAFNETRNGRTLTWSELGWAAVDAVVIWEGGPIVKTGGKVLFKVGKQGLQSLLKDSAEAGPKELIEFVANGEGKPTIEIGAPGVLQAAEKAVAVAEARSLLSSAGTSVTKATADLSELVFDFGLRHPTVVIGSATLVFATLRPDLVDRVLDRLRDVVLQGSKTLSRTVADAPGQVLEGMWEELATLKQKNPMLAWLYYVLSMILFLTAFFVIPLLLLRMLLRPIYSPLKQGFIVILGSIYRASKWVFLVSLRTMRRSKRRRIAAVQRA